MTAALVLLVSVVVVTIASLVMFFMAAIEDHRRSRTSSVKPGDLTDVQPVMVYVAFEKLAPVQERTPNFLRDIKAEPQNYFDQLGPSLVKAQ